jgi:hypothetical protein
MLVLLASLFIRLENSVFRKKQLQGTLSSIRKTILRKIDPLETAILDTSLGKIQCSSISYRVAGEMQLLERTVSSQRLKRREPTISDIIPTQVDGLEH